MRALAIEQFAEMQKLYTEEYEYAQSQMNAISRRMYQPTMDTPEYTAAVKLPQISYWNSKDYKDLNNWQLMHNPSETARDRRRIHAYKSAKLNFYDRFETTVAEQATLKNKIALCVERVGLRLEDRETHGIVQLEIQKFKTGLELRSNGMSVELELKRFTVEDVFSKSSQWPYLFSANLQNDVSWTLHFESVDAQGDKNAEKKITLGAQSPANVVLVRACVDRVVTFLTDMSVANVTLSDNALVAAAAPMVYQVSDTLKSSIVSEHTTVVVKANIKAPNLLIPLDVTKPSCEVLAVLLGDLYVRTLVQTELELRESVHEENVYDKYAVKVQNVEVVLVERVSYANVIKDSEWLAKSLKQAAATHFKFVEKLGLSICYGKSMIPQDPGYAHNTIAAQLDRKTKLQVSPDAVKHLMSLISSPPSAQQPQKQQADEPQPVPQNGSSKVTAGAAAEDVTEESSAMSLEHIIAVELFAGIPQLQIQLMQHADGGLYGGLQKELIKLKINHLQLRMKHSILLIVLVEVQTFLNSI